MTGERKSEFGFFPEMRGELSVEKAADAGGCHDLSDGLQLVPVPLLGTDPLSAFPFPKRYCREDDEFPEKPRLVAYV